MVSRGNLLRGWVLLYNKWEWLGIKIFVFEFFGKYVMCMEFCLILIEDIDEVMFLRYNIVVIYGYLGICV